MAASYGAAFLFLAFVVSFCCCSLPWADADTDCTTALTGLLGCSSFLTNTSSTPDKKTCCTPLGTVLSTPSSFKCLCAQASGSGSTQTYKNALLLPAACKLSIVVSEANCTQSSSSSTTSSNSTTTTANTGIMSASPMLPLVLALLWSFVSFFA